MAIPAMLDKRLAELERQQALRTLRKKNEVVRCEMADGSVEQFRWPDDVDNWDLLHWLHDPAHTRECDILARSVRVSPELGMVELLRSLVVAEREWNDE